jgi:hypothetical protein
MTLTREKEITKKKKEREKNDKKDCVALVYTLDENKRFLIWRPERHLSPPGLAMTNEGG